jgi:hypothetical protein
VAGLGSQLTGTPATVTPVFSDKRRFRTRTNITGHGDAFDVRERAKTSCENR